MESEHISELTEEEYETHIYQRQDLKGFMWLDAKYLNPFFTRRLTQEVGSGGVGGGICVYVQRMPYSRWWVGASVSTWEECPTILLMGLSNEPPPRG